MAVSSRTASCFGIAPIFFAVGYGLLDFIRHIENQFVAHLEISGIRVRYPAYRIALVHAISDGSHCSTPLGGLGCSQPGSTGGISKGPDAINGLAHYGWKNAEDDRLEAYATKMTGWKA